MYILDGYNLVFTLTELDHPLAIQREKVIRFLQKRFAQFKMAGLLVFDGKVYHGEESGRSYPSPLEVVYTPKGQSADAYIIEQLENAKNPRIITIVTNDRGIMANARALGAKTIKNNEFIEWLLSRKKKSTTPKPEAVDTKHNIERLLAIFEKKLKEED